MATITVDPKHAVFYYPDGPNAPITLLFPLSSDIPDGTRVKIMNATTSNTPVTFLAQGSDTIANPEEVAEFAASHIVELPELITEYILVGTKWFLSGHGDPDLRANTLATFTMAAYGGLDLSAPIASGDIGATWDTIDVFDTIKYATPKYITQNLTNSSLAVTYPGVYIFNIVLNYSHNELNASRVTYLRIYNLTDAVAGAAVEIPIARNQPSTLISIAIDGELLAGKEYVLQIGNGDDITAVTVRGASFSINGIGEFRGTL